MKVRRPEIIEYLNSGNYRLSEGIYSDMKYKLYHTTDLLYIRDCHKGDVEKMIAKGELVRVPDAEAEYKKEWRLSASAKESLAIPATV